LSQVAAIVKSSTMDKSIDINPTESNR